MSKEPVYNIFKVMKQLNITSRSAFEKAMGLSRGYSYHWTKNGGPGDIPARLNAQVEKLLSEEEIPAPVPKPKTKLRKKKKMVVEEITSPLEKEKAEENIVAIVGRPSDVINALSKLKLTKE